MTEAQGGKVELICDNCGVTFLRFRSQVHDGRHFCGRACDYAAPKPEPTTKTCRSCGVEKPIGQFPKAGNRKAGGHYYRPDCLNCSNERSRTRRAQQRPPAQVGMFRICNQCNTEYPLSAFPRFTRVSRKTDERVYYHNHTCKECLYQERRKKRRDNPERHRQYDRRSYQRNREQVIKRKMQLNARRRARMYQSGTIENIHVEVIIERDGLVCYLCQRELDRSEVTIDHVIPLARGGEHSYENVRVACNLCNARKTDRLLSEIDLSEFH